MSPWSAWIAAAFAVPLVDLTPDGWAPVSGGELSEGFRPPDGALVDADGCPLVMTDVSCTDALWASACGAKEIQKPDSVCLDEFWDYAARSYGALPFVPVVDPRTGVVQVVRFEAYNPTAITWSGFDAAYAPHLLRLSHPRSTADRLAAEADLAWWDTNCSVQSCAELAYESFEGFSSFEARVAPDLAAGRYRAIVDAAFSADGIARKTVDARPLRDRGRGRRVLRLRHRQRPAPRRALSARSSVHGAAPPHRSGEQTRPGSTSVIPKGEIALFRDPTPGYRPGGGVRDAAH